jgi:hypothetical protein
MAVPVLYINISRKINKVSEKYQILDDNGDPIHEPTLQQSYQMSKKFNVDASKTLIRERQNVWIIQYFIISLVVVLNFIFTYDSALDKFNGSVATGGSSTCD